MSLKTYDLQLGHVRAREAREFRFMFAIAFILFLVAGILSRLFTLFRKKPARKSLIAEAKTAANTCISFAFMR